MNRFIVISPDHEKIQEAVEGHFSDHCYQIMPGVWAVAGAEVGPADVCKNIQMVPGGESKGMVLPLDSYYGLFDNALWEKVSIWEDLHE